jgi:transcriptional regulator with XRE-family HTH domain
METGKVIREKRLDRNMTQKELGLLLGYGEDSAQVRVSSFESGQKVPRKKIKKISELLDIPIELLID